MACAAFVSLLTLIYPKVKFYRKSFFRKITAIYKIEATEDFLIYSVLSRWLFFTQSAQIWPRKLRHPAAILKYSGKKQMKLNPNKFGKNQQE